MRRHGVLYVDVRRAVEVRDRVYGHGPGDVFGGSRGLLNMHRVKLFGDGVHITVAMDVDDLFGTSARDNNLEMSENYMREVSSEIKVNKEGVLD